MGDHLRNLVRAALGRRQDWMIRRPALSWPRPALSWLGVVVLIASVVVAWLPMADAQGEHGNAAFGLWVGAVSIILMAWSFLLAVRVRVLEPLFGGLDRMYRVHRWAGSLAVIAMFLHTSIEPEIEGGIRGAAKSTAATAQDLAGVGEILLYGSIAISLIRWVPYRWWRLVHKLIGLPFAFACWHFYTARKPYANGSGWGWYFGIIMIVGLVAWFWRVVGRDMLRPGIPYEVDEVRRHGITTEIALRPTSKARLNQRLGQFAVVKLQLPGLQEPHLFTVASPPDDDRLRFFIRGLGDWTDRIQEADLAGAKVVVEGPFGQFRPLPASSRPILWVAGGVGITPFLAATESLAPAAEGDRPVLAYCVRSADDAVAIERLRAAHADGRIHLVLFESSAGRRFDASTTLAELARHLPTGTIKGAHVAVCGPAGLVADTAAAARSAGAHEVETEDFDIRSGIGPDLSRDLAKLTQELSPTATAS